ncbi:hypothetical protein [Saccharothrix syringae]|uniref:Uncharacterized protein n=1 Tax=Saccharothrix syringae TaxID=103733 RepID=A0A5Q0HAM3_SACSY|nr:hypothetical protein [Saccharothrix syringae]QFZ22850.1 hypothetical protein EKG83_40335 [Saccharothrix syringae]
MGTGAGGVNRRVVAAAAQLALLVVGIPVVYLVAFPFRPTAQSLLPPLGLLAALVVGGLLARRDRDPLTGAAASWLVFAAAVGAALAVG